ncbi:MAG: hypothetical protein ABIU87_10655 [Ornithinibacter sp.]
MARVLLGDVDVLRKTLEVTPQVQCRNGGAVDVRAKKYGSERVVYLADSLVDLLAEHVAPYGTAGTDQWLFAGEVDTESICRQPSDPRNRTCLQTASRRHRS